MFVLMYVSMYAKKNYVVIELNMISLVIPILGRYYKNP